MTLNSSSPVSPLTLVTGPAPVLTFNFVDPGVQASALRQILARDQRRAEFDGENRDRDRKRLAAARGRPGRGIATDLVGSLQRDFRLPPATTDADTR